MTPGPDGDADAPTFIAEPAADQNTGLPTINTDAPTIVTSSLSNTIQTGTIQHGEAGSKAGRPAWMSDTRILGGIGGGMLLLLIVIASMAFKSDPTPNPSDEKVASITKGQSRASSVSTDQSKSLTEPAASGKSTNTVSPPVASSVPGEFALEFDGQGDYVVMPTLTYDGSHPITVEAWITPSERMLDGAHILNTTDIDGVLDGFGLKWKGLQSSWAFEAAYSARRWVEPTMRVTEHGTKRIHLAGVIDDKHVTLFVNGKPTTKTALGRIKFVPSEQPVTLGAVAPFDSVPDYAYFAGKMHAVRVSESVRYTESFTARQRFESDGDTIALYHFDEGLGDVLKDSSGNGHHGKIVGAKWIKLDATAGSQYPTGVPGVNNALQISHVNNRHYTSVDSLKFTGETAYTIEGRFLAFEFNPALRLNMPLTFGPFRIYSDHSRQLGVKIDEAFGSITTEQKPTAQWPNPPRWIHVAAVLTKNRLRLYQDGKLVQESGLTTNWAPHDHPFAMGLRWNGLVDEIRISNLARYDDDFTPPERHELDQSTLALYHFDEGQGNVFKDSSGNGHHGKTEGAKWVRVGGSVPPETLLSDQREIDLITMAAEVAAEEGLWRITDDSLILTPRAQGKARIQYPITIDEACEIELSISQQPGAEESFAVIAPAGSSQFRLEINSPKGDPLKRFWGFGNTLVRQRVTIEKNRRYNVTMRVEPEGDRVRIRATLDGHPSIDWEGKQSDIQAYHVGDTSEPPFLALEAWKGSRFTVHKATLRQLGGKGDLTTDDKPTSPAASAPPPAVAPFDAAQAKTHQKAWAKHLGEPVEKIVALPGGEKMVFVLVPPGEFMMGSSAEEQARFLKEARALDDLNADNILTESRHHVVISQPFALGQHEVTRGQFRQFVAATAYRTEAETNGIGGGAGIDGKFGKSPDILWNTEYGLNLTDKHPVVQVSWNDAQAFCKWLSESSDSEVFLPTEAQWEYACRAGTTTAWQTGDDPVHLSQVLKNGKMLPVGSSAPNAWKLYDMHGNVFEWCDDNWSEDFYEQTPLKDPVFYNGKNLRVTRGGAFDGSSYNRRSAGRYYAAAHRGQVYNCGFRVALKIAAGN